LTGAGLGSVDLGQREDLGAAVLTYLDRLHAPNLPRQRGGNPLVPAPSPVSSVPTPFPVPTQFQLSTTAVDALGSGGADAFGAVPVATTAPVRSSARRSTFAVTGRTNAPTPSVSGTVGPDGSTCSCVAVRGARISTRVLSSVDVSLPLPPLDGDSVTSTPRNAKI